MSTDQHVTRIGPVTLVRDDPRARKILGIVGFVLATTASAYVAVPLPWTQVPMTLQPLAVILAGALLGPWAGASSMVAYLMLGAAGAPVFSMGRAGLPWLMGPTGGYLIAYPAAAYVVGRVVQRSSDPAGGGIFGRLRTPLGLSLGVAVIYLGGVSQLAILTGGSLTSVLAMGVVPFLTGDVVKVLIALVVVEIARTGRTNGGPG
jgi:biotin transport system substrate-specific component